MRRAGRWVGIALLTLIALFLVARAVVEVATVDPSNPATYRDDWGGPTYLGVLAVHAGPGLAVLVAVAWWSFRSRKQRHRP
jgi:hypothetical protein